MGSGLVPHPGPASPLLSVLSPLGANRLLSGPSGLDNLFNEEVRRAQAFVAYLPRCLNANVLRSTWGSMWKASVFEYSITPRNSA